MDSAIVLLLAVLAVLPKPTQDPQNDVVATWRMTQRAIFLEKKMNELWEEIESRKVLAEVPLLWILQHWLFWVAAAAVLCWLAWQRGQQGSCRGERRRAAGAVRIFAKLRLSVLQRVPSKSQILKKLVRDLLEVCQVLSQDTFMPELHPATVEQGPIEFCHDLGHRVIYHLLVCLRPPPKHSFHLQLPDHTMDGPERRCRVRVLLECSCSRTMATPLCFAHPTYNHLHSPVLRTLCTDSYLELEKIIAWVQQLVQSAWERLPQWHDWQLRVQPTSHSCRLLLTGPGQEQLCAVLLLALQQGPPGTFLVLE